MSATEWMPLVFLGLMGLALLIYVVLDGYDLGVGLLMLGASEAQQDRMVASIGPFWDANETWLVLGVGLLLVAFPKAHGLILQALYLPVALMLLGLMLRGVAFDFRVKAQAQWKPLWNAAFMGGSALAATAQGWMLARYITGFAEGWAYTAFAAVIALALAAAYALLGAAWLIMKMEGELQTLAVRRAKLAWPAVLLGLLLVSVITPLVSPTVAARWFSLPEFIALLPIPLMTALSLLALRGLLNSHRVLGKLCWAPFALMVVVMLLGFLGLAYSLFPFVIMDRMTVWQAAAATDSLRFILWGAALTVPAILGYTVFAYRVFWGKSGELNYA
ncbi:cytochrome d ubiquinol oxidase subunit II [Paucibacter oligotrophus]|uniref:Cytochrome d ubiquinol oxidase subunit II n=1 Tax=Roseateles oligotrophus TaxID=1769250 RepID=A0A840L2W3_9BURK|nr:cytochrome d ubiquinol oxidase subunit II [Roseateles oligotrophus]MBB4842171.1 cytochrome d ubiquinol oxidase subunit II [Roseateles oligotrophus]